MIVRMRAVIGDKQIFEHDFDIENPSDFEEFTITLPDSESEDPNMYFERHITERKSIKAVGELWHWPRKAGPS